VHIFCKIDLQIQSKGSVILKDFFGFGTGEYPYGRPADGFLSWQHLVLVLTLVIVGVSLAIILGKLNKNKDDKTKNTVLIWAAILIDGFEIAKIIIGSVQDPSYWRVSLPLFLCSIQLITIPLAAFSKGRFKEASLDFVLIFGILGGVLGTVGATQNYNAYPAFSWPNVVSGITHTISAFASIYIAVSGMTSMKKKNIPITFGILFGFGITAYIVNLILDYNYMFLMNHDGTPYVLLYNLVNGNKILYPISVMLLFVVYVSMFYAIYLKIQKRKIKKLQ
jgi:uncharacterized membrane protein YwaF